MPRSKPKKAQPNFFAAPYPLSDNDKDKLSGLLENNRAGIIQEIEKWLGLYVNGADHLDKPPRPADYVCAFNPINRDATKLLSALYGLGGYFSDELAKRNANIDEIESAITKLFDVSAAIVLDYKLMPSQGAPKSSALTVVTKELRRIFSYNYKGPVTGRKSKNNIQSRGEEEMRELDFVKTALLAARIIRTRNPEAKVAHLFRDPRCALVNERPVTLERLANRAHRNRKQKGNR